MMSCIQKMLLLLSAFCYGCVEAMEKPKEIDSKVSTSSLSGKTNAADACKNVSDEELKRFNEGCGYIVLEKSSDGVIATIKESTLSLFDPNYLNTFKERKTVITESCDDAYRVLFRAIRLSCFEIISYCVKVGCDLNDTYYYEKVSPSVFGGRPSTFLIDAIAGVISCDWKVELIERLLELGADPNKEGEGILPINFILNKISRGNNKEFCINLLKLLLKNKADPNLQNTGQERITPLEMAIGNKIPEAVRILLDFGADANCIKCGEGRSPLKVAICSGSLEIVKILLDAGADPNHETEDKISPLFLAIYMDKPEIVEVLSKAGADLTCVDNDGITPLIRAINDNKTEIIKTLLKVGADPNQKSKNELYTPLLLAISQNRLGIIETLLDAGADPNCENNSGLTPLFFAIRENKLEILRLMLDRGIGVDKKNKYGATSVGVAFDRLVFGKDNTKMTHVIQMLLEVGADPDQEVAGRSLLTIAISLDNDELIDMLLKFGATPDQKDSYGLSPIEYAIRSNKVKAAVALFKNGATTLNRYSRDAAASLEYAVRMKNVEIVKALIENGADPNNCYGRIARIRGIVPLIFCAIATGKSEMVSALINQVDNINEIVPIWGTHMTALDFIELLRFSESEKEKVKQILISKGAKNAQTIIAEAREAERREREARIREEEARAAEEARIAEDIRRVNEANEAMTSNSTIAR